MGGKGSGRKAGSRLKTTNKKHEAIRAYKLEGHTSKEVADHFGISYDWAKEICKGLYVDTERHGKAGQFKAKNIEAVKAMIKQSNPNIEYVDGYKDADSMVSVRCLVCGDVFEHSMISIRHGHQTTCQNCKQIEQQLAKERREAEKRERQIIAIQTRAKREAEKQNEKLHECPACGQLTTRRKYCSEVCCRNACKSKANQETKRRHNATHEAKRRSRIKSQIVDRDITLKQLFERDNGICWICGMVCDWSDFTKKDDNFIAGNLYPSIDHVVELSNGGVHSWNNVKLAHRICNVKRYWSPISRAI